jgi:hypothetical protein
MSFATTGGSTYTLSSIVTPPIFWASGDFPMNVTASGFHTFPNQNLSYDENIESPNSYCCSISISAAIGGLLSLTFDISSSVNLSGQEILVPEPRAVPLMGGPLAVLALYQLNRARLRRGRSRALSLR